MEHLVDVVATKVGQKIEFTPDSNLWRAPSRDYPDGMFEFSKSELRMNRADHHNIRFRLDDQTGLGLRFPVNPKNAFWVISGRRCPTQNDTSDYNMMYPTSVEAKPPNGLRNTLSVRNKNEEVEDWSFSLNFIKRDADEGDPRNYVRWDPVGSNQNSGFGFWSSAVQSTQLAWSVALIALAAVAYLLIYQ